MTTIFLIICLIKILLKPEDEVFLQAARGHSRALHKEQTNQPPQRYPGRGLIHNYGVDICIHHYDMAINISEQRWTGTTIFSTEQAGWGNRKVSCDGPGPGSARAIMSRAK